MFVMTHLINEKGGTVNSFVLTLWLLMWVKLSMSIGFHKTRPVFLYDQAFGNWPFPVEKIPELDILQTCESWPLSLPLSSCSPPFFQEKWKQSRLLIQALPYVGGIHIFHLPGVFSALPLHVVVPHTLPFWTGLMWILLVLLLSQVAWWTVALQLLWLASGLIPSLAKLVSSVRITADTWGHHCAWFCLLCVLMSPPTVTVRVRNMRRGYGQDASVSLPWCVSDLWERTPLCFGKLVQKPVVLWKSWIPAVRRR